jgi:hypothetical protein
VSWAFKAALGTLGLRVTQTSRDDGLSQPFSEKTSQSEQNTR